MLDRFFVGMFRQPTGFFGRLVGGLMAKSHAYEAQWTVSLLDIQSHHQVLEIGFGPGIAIQHATQKAVNGLVVGIDYAQTMVRMASDRNTVAIKAGRLLLQQGDATSLPYPTASFDTVFSIHCIYFWANPVGVLTQINRVLKPGGLVALTIMSNDKSSTKRAARFVDLYTLYTSDEVADLLMEAGFQNVRLQASIDKFAGVCILGNKP